MSRVNLRVCIECDLIVVHLKVSFTCYHGKESENKNQRAWSYIIGCINYGLNLHPDGQQLKWN